jgi:hypothetical protein
VVSPAIELLHKITALMTSLVLVFGTYAWLSPDFRTFTLASLPETASAAAAAPATLQRALLDLAHDLSSLIPPRASVNASVVAEHELPSL